MPYLNLSNRQRLRTSDEELAAEFGKIVELFAQALPQRADAQAFCERFNAEGNRGKTWVEALERTVAARER